MHTTKRLWGLGLIAILVAACSTTGGQASAKSPTIASAPPVTEAPSVGGPRRPRPLRPTSAPRPRCRPSPRARSRSAPTTRPTRRTSRRRSARHRSVGAGRPDQRQGLRERLRVRARRAARLRPRGGQRGSPVPFDNAFAPGPKDFDIDINQVSFTPERAQTVDMSDGYYFVNQAVVAHKDTPVAKATTLAELKD